MRTGVRPNFLERIKGALREEGSDYHESKSSPDDPIRIHASSSASATPRQVRFLPGNRELLSPARPRDALVLCDISNHAPRQGHLCSLFDRSQLSLLVITTVSLLSLSNTTCRVSLPSRFAPCHGAAVGDSLLRTICSLLSLHAQFIPCSSALHLPDRYMRPAFVFAGSRTKNYSGNEHHHV